MNIQEAKAYLSYSDVAETLEDFYENFLFEQKNYFRERPIIELVLKARLTKIRRSQQAFRILGITDDKVNFENLTVEFNDIILSVFNHYYGVKNVILQKIYNCTNLEQLCYFAEELILLEKKYAELWDLRNINENTALKPDPMFVLADIKKLEQKGISKLSQIDFKNLEDFRYLRAELIRLKQVNR